jgi:hypothetical protein
MTHNNKGVGFGKRQHGNMVYRTYPSNLVLLTVTAGQKFRPRTHFYPRLLRQQKVRALPVAPPVNSPARPAALRAHFMMSLIISERLVEIWDTVCERAHMRWRDDHAENALRLCRELSKQHSPKPSC